MHDFLYIKLSTGLTRRNHTHLEYSFPLLSWVHCDRFLYRSAFHRYKTPVVFSSQVLHFLLPWIPHHCILLLLLHSIITIKHNTITYTRSLSFFLPASTCPSLCTTIVFCFFLSTILMSSGVLRYILSNYFQKSYLGVFFLLLTSNKIWNKAHLRFKNYRLVMISETCSVL